MIVLPEFHKLGIGDKIMAEIENWLKNNTFENSFIGLMAASGVEGFYEKYGYTKRDPDRPGMFKIMR